MEIERTKPRLHLEAERKLENLTAVNDRLQRGSQRGLTVERDALAVAQDELLARASGSRADW